MITLDAVASAAHLSGEVINPVFEERLVNLVNILHQIAVPLQTAGIDYELVGGMAVLVHVEEADPEHAMLTRDVDILVNRADLEKIINVASQHGFRFRHVAGLDMLTFGETDSAKNAVRLLFSGEFVRPTQATPHPSIAPTRKVVFGEEVFVVPLVDLLRMKLSAFRLKDQVHVQVMDAAGLITPALENTLPEELQLRLRQVRDSD